MQLNQATTGQLERLHLLGCPVVVRQGVPHASVYRLALARINAVVHALRIHSLRRYWARERLMDRCLGPGPSRFWESYVGTKHQAHQVLPSRWFNRA